MGAAGIQMLVAVGQATQETADGARRAGVDEVHHHLDSVRCAESLGDLLRDGDLIVVKGSRGIRMDHIVRALIFRFAEGH